MLSNSGLCLRTAVQYVLLFSVLAVNLNRFQILQSYMVLLKPLVLLRSYFEYSSLVLLQVLP